MKIGFLTNCLNMDLSQKVEEASKMGFKDLEVVCGNSEYSDIYLEHSNMI